MPPRMHSRMHSRRTRCGCIGCIECIQCGPHWMHSMHPMHPDECAASAFAGAFASAFASYDEWVNYLRDAKPAASSEAADGEQPSPDEETMKLYDNPPENGEDAEASYLDEDTGTDLRKRFTTGLEFLIQEGVIDVRPKIPVVGKLRDILDGADALHEVEQVYNEEKKKFSGWQASEEEKMAKFKELKESVLGKDPRFVKDGIFQMRLFEEGARVEASDLQEEGVVLSTNKNKDMERLGNDAEAKKKAKEEAAAAGGEGEGAGEGADGSGGVGGRKLSLDFDLDDPGDDSEMPSVGDIDNQAQDNENVDSVLRLSPEEEKQLELLDDMLSEADGGAAHHDQAAGARSTGDADAADAKVAQLAGGESNEKEVFLSKLREHDMHDEDKTGAFVCGGPEKIERIHRAYDEEVLEMKRLAYEHLPTRYWIDAMRKLKGVPAQGSLRKEEMTDQQYFVLIREATQLYDRVRQFGNSVRRKVGLEVTQHEINPGLYQRFLKLVERLEKLAKLLFVERYKCKDAQKMDRLAKYSDESRVSMFLDLDVVGGGGTKGDAGILSGARGRSCSFSRRRWSTRNTSFADVDVFFGVKGDVRIKLGAAAAVVASVFLVLCGRRWRSRKSEFGHFRLARSFWHQRLGAVCF
eukprot:g13032.t1